MESRYECPACGKITAGRVPRGGNGTMIHPRKHRANGSLCPGRFEEAIWVSVENGKVVKRYEDRNFF